MANKVKTKTANRAKATKPALSPEALKAALAVFMLAEDIIIADFKSGKVSGPSTVKLMQRLTTARNNL